MSSQFLTTYFMIIMTDEIFLLRVYLVKPYSRRELQYKSRFSHRHLTRARRVVECSFGLLNKTISVLEKVVRSSAEKAEFFITNPGVLCNCLMKWNNNRMMFYQKEQAN
jgi:hypothetical protein